VNVYVGTSGFSYKEWKGAFYPEDLPASEMLAYYSTRLNAVEINNTFYRMPSAKLLDGWAERVSGDFSFVLKASQRITHHKRLKEAEEPLSYLLETTARLGDRLGPMLFQLPPYLKKDVERLASFVALFPDGFRAAFEFRHETWFDPEVYEVLESRHLALVTADTDDDKPAPVTLTAPYGYARLRRERYEPGELETWARRLTEPGWADLYVFFKHEDAGAGPRLAARFRDMALECGA
jgi:uncharacterized protein YecE (DUF72 family)